MDVKQFGAFVQAMRHSRGMTQSQLGEKLGVTDKAISRWERGIGFPDISLLEPLANALEITVVELMRSERMEHEQITIEEAENIMVQTIDLAAEQNRTKWRSRLLRFGVLPLIYVVWFFLTMVITWYVREPFWLRVACLLVVSVCLTFGSSAVRYVARCRYLNPPKPLGQHISTAISCIGVLVLGLSWLLNTDGLRHLYAPVTLAGLAMVFALPLYYAWRTCKEEPKES